MYKRESKRSFDRHEPISRHSGIQLNNNTDEWRIYVCISYTYIRNFLSNKTHSYFWLHKLSTILSFFFLLHLSAVFSPNCYVNCIAMEGVAKPVILIESSKWNEVWTYHKCHQSNDKMIVLCTIIGFNLTLYCWLENMSKLHEIQSNLDAIYKFNENHSNYWEKRFN